MDNTDIKICKRCKMKKDKPEFWVMNSQPDKLDYYCKECRKELIAIGRKRFKEDNENTVETDLAISRGHRRKAKLFAFWLSIPGVVKSSKHFRKYFHKIRLTKGDENILPEVLKCNTFSELAKVLQIGVQTLKAWQDSKFVKDLERKFDEESDVLSFKKEVDFSFTQKVISIADAARVKLWKQLYEGWVEKTSQETTYDEENIATIQSKLRELAEKRGVKKIGPVELKEKLKVYKNGEFFIPAEASGNYARSGANAGGSGQGKGDSQDAV